MSLFFSTYVFLPLSMNKYISGLDARLVADNLLAYLINLYSKGLHSNILSGTVKRKVAHFSLYLLISCSVSTNFVIDYFGSTTPQSIFTLLHERMFSLIG